jgi:hypothetical protein
MSDDREGMKACIWRNLLDALELKDSAGAVSFFISHNEEDRARHLRKSDDPVFAEQINALADTANAIARQQGLSIGAFSGGGLQ